MADFMAHHERQLGFVIHQRQQLPGDVDIAAGYGEGVVIIGIEQGDGIIGRPRRHPGLGSNALADGADILGLRPTIGPAELGDELGMLLRAQLLVRGGKPRRLGCAGAGQQGEGEKGEAEFAHGPDCSAAMLAAQ